MKPNDRVIMLERALRPYHPAVKRLRRELGVALAAHPEILDCWVIYERPKDYPNQVVARNFMLNTEGVNPMPTHLAFSTDSMKEMLEIMQHSGRIRFMRNAADDPIIAEIWL